MQTYGVIERIAEALWDKCKAEGDEDILKAEKSKHQTKVGTSRSSYCGTVGW